MKYLNGLPKVINKLFPSGKQDASFKLFAILDTARSKALYYKIMEFALRKHCLFEKAESRGLGMVAPWLVELKMEDYLLKWIVKMGFRRSWGVFLLSSANFKTLAAHYMKLTEISDESGKSYIFRYYDPRVLSVFFPNCSAKGQNYLLYPARNFILENPKKRGWITFGKVPGVSTAAPIFGEKHKKAFRRSLAEAFEDRMLAEMAKKFPEKFQEPAGKSKAYSMIYRSIKRAAGYNIHEDDNVAQYIRLTCKIQPDFELMEGMEWVREILENDSLSEKAKMDMVVNLTKDMK